VFIASTLLMVVPSVLQHVVRSTDYAASLIFRSGAVLAASILLLATSFMRLGPVSTDLALFVLMVAYSIVLLTESIGDTSSDTVLVDVGFSPFKVFPRTVLRLRTLLTRISNR
jgi:hypothetical protein